MTTAPFSAFSRLEQALQAFHRAIQDAMPGYLVERDRLEPFTTAPGISIAVNAGDATTNARPGQLTGERIQWAQSVEVLIFAPRDGMPTRDGTPRSMVTTVDPIVAQIYRAALADRGLGDLCVDVTPQGRGLRPSGKSSSDIYVGLLFELTVLTGYSDLTTTGSC